MTARAPSPSPIPGPVPPPAVFRAAEALARMLVARELRALRADAAESFERDKAMVP